jgi:hypothetical protein
MSENRSGYVAAFESHHVPHLESFDNYESASACMHGWATDVHTWPVCIYDAENNRLWLWCGYRTLDIGREAALEDARGILRLPADHHFAIIETMRENL